jgi:hypothetical protein
MQTKLIKLQKGASNNHSAINWFDGLSPLAISEVNRRWESFFKQFNIRSAEMIEVCGSSPKVLEANYRKTV